jgi:hypothetical protein
VRGAFPDDLGELVTLGLLGSRDTRLPDARRLSYTEAPVSYLLAIEGEARVESDWVNNKIPHHNSLV